MCPDKEILSAYNDGELDAGLCGRIETHIHSCAECRAALDGFARLNGVLHSRGSEEIEAQEAARIRVWQGIMRSRDRRRYLSPLLRYLRMPLPALIMVALFSMGLGAGGMALLSRSTPTAVAEMPVIPESGNFSSAEELLSFLQQSDSGVNITIQLPDEPLFIVVGEPQLLRAAEYRRGE